MRVSRHVICVVLAALGMAGVPASRSSLYAQAPREMLA